ncbi:MAG: CcmD family protein [Gemmatimonadota bacterium]
MTNEWVWVAAAYGLTWVTLAGYLVYLARQAKRVREELSTVQGDEARLEP